MPVGEGRFIKAASNFAWSAIDCFVWAHEQGYAVMQKKGFFFCERCNSRIGSYAHGLRTTEERRVVRTATVSCTISTIIECRSQTQTYARPACYALDNSHQHSWREHTPMAVKARRKVSNIDYVTRIILHACLQNC